MKIPNILVLFLAAATHAQAPPTGDLLDDEQAAASDARLERAIPLLDDADAADRLAAVLEIGHQARKGKACFDRVERFLVRTTADPDPEIAALAARALDAGRRAPRAERGAKNDGRRHVDRHLLAWAGHLLAPPDAPTYSATDRLAAMHVLISAGERNRSWSSELEWLVGEARRSGDPEIAYLAETMLARYEDRPMDPDLRRPPRNSAGRPGQPSRTDAVYAATHDPNPRVRLSSLRWVVDIALAEGAGSDPRILDALVARRDDPDPQVASYARFALRRLAGDENEHWQVYTAPGSLKK